VITESDLDFLHAVWSRRPLFTYLFFGINIAVFLLMTFAGGTTNDSTLLAFGVKANALINQGQYWRFLTPVFIHIGLLHLFFNSYALWIVGPQVEKLYGGPKFVLIYLVTGMAGVASSYWYRPEGLSAGASGAIFGLFGALLVFGLRHRHSIPPFFRRAVGTGVLPVIVINLIIGFSIPMIDNSAHLGGLVSGMFLAAVIPFERPRSTPSIIFTAIQIGLLALVAVSFFFVYKHYDGPRLAFQNVYHGWGDLIGGHSSTAEFIDAINGAERAFVESEKTLENDRRAELPARIKDVGTSIDVLKKAPSVTAKADDMTGQLVKLMQDQYELLKDVDRGGTVTLAEGRQANQNAQRFEQWINDFNSWVDAEGQRYGIQLRERR